MAYPPDDNPDPHGVPAGDGSDTGRSSTSGDEPTRVPGSDSGSSAGHTGGDAIPLGPSIQGYALKEELHRGGQGVVYRAVQLGTKREVALKVLLEGAYASQTARSRFEREIELAASLQHPHIVTILDSGTSLGRYFCAMELVQGIRLDRYLAQHRLPLRQTLELFEKICDAVNYAHQRGVIHRDLKPPNILVDDFGEPHVLDFGLAKPASVLAGGESTVQALSLSGQLLGTVAYMSPEQAAGQHNVDVRTDVYSLGVIFYEALTGQPPYAVDCPLAEVLTRIGRDDPASPRSVGANWRSDFEIDDELATILLKSLEKEPSRRYQTAGDLGRDLRHYLDGDPIEAKRASGLYMLKKTLRRYRLQAMTAGLILSMLLAFLVVLTVLFASEREARREADLKTVEAEQRRQEARVAVETKEAALQRAVQAQKQLRHALVRQHIQRGDLSLERNDVVRARDSYWEAHRIAPGPATRWALRRFYLETASDAAGVFALVPSGPSAIDCDGQFAAVCETADSISVYEVGSGNLVDWYQAPGPIGHLAIGPNGHVAARGDDWLRLWQRGSLRPVLASSPARDFTTIGLEIAHDGTAVFELTPRGVVYTNRDESPRFARLHSMPRNKPDVMPMEHGLAVPTMAGVELVRALPDGQMTTRVLWHREGELASAVRFDDADALGVLTTGGNVLATSWPVRRSNEWRELRSASTDEQPPWQLFDFSEDASVLVLATLDGHFSLARAPADDTTWQFAVERLSRIVLSERHEALIVMDARGELTRWIHPERVEQRRPIRVGAPVQWVTSSDGSTLLMADARGHVELYAPDFGPKPRTVLRPRLLGFGRGDQVALALSADGSRGLVRDGAVLRYIETGDLVARIENWDDAAYPAAGHVAVSTHGEYFAVVASTRVGDRQRIRISPWHTRGPSDPRIRDYEFTGAAIREMRFQPGTDRLCVLRSNGQMFLLDLRADTATTPTGSLSPWLELHARATSIAFSRDGRWIAVACEDESVRVLSAGDGSISHRIPIRPRVSSLDFNPRDGILLIRTADGMINLYDPASGEHLTRWLLESQSRRPLAAWSGGPTDALILGHDGAIWEYRYAEADRMIEENEPYAQQQRIARLLAAGNFPGAWAEATVLSTLHPRIGLQARESVLVAALRRGYVRVPEDWITAIDDALTARSLARLGHAAYDGERFARARGWLRRAYALSSGEVDAFTLWRIAACDYLARDFADAEVGFAAVQQQSDFSPERKATLMLQHVATLWMMGEETKAKTLAKQINARPTFGDTENLIATTFASVTASRITELDRDNPHLAALNTLVGSVGQQTLQYRDDEHFYVGELALRAGRDEEAMIHYQRCIDISRDVWPANWARFRLQELTADDAMDESRQEEDG